MGMGEAKAAAQEEQERQERLDEKGLCFHCEEEPQNPYINAKVCLDCWSSERHMGCMHKGCPNSSAGNFRQGQYCEVHLADRIHKAYESYLKQKDKVEQMEQEVNDMASDLDRDPRDSSIAPRDMNEAQQEVRDKHLQVKLERQELGRIRSVMEKAMKSLDEPFPEGYEVFG